MTEPKKYVLSEADERRLQSLRLLDDDFMSMVFDNNIWEPLKIHGYRLNGSLT